MKNLIFLLLILASCSPDKQETRQKMSLAGEWGFRIDSLDEGIRERWYESIPEDRVKLPGSMAENGKGDEVTLRTPWTGDIVDRSYFTREKYARYRQAGNIKIPFWLKPVKYYKGPAWYQKEVEIPAGWKNRSIVLFLERPHWESTVFVNGVKAGTQNSLAVPHQFEISGLLKEGMNLISIRIDNSIIIPVGVNSHSISDHTQSNWNGIAGDISLRATSPVFISDVSVYPDVQRKSARVIAKITNRSQAEFSGKVIIKAESFNTPQARKLKSMTAKIRSGADHTELVFDYPMGNNFSAWSEFKPAMYRMNVSLRNSDGTIDNVSEDFGMREFKVEGTRFAVNGRQIFLRGTTECCIFPLTGYPPSDTASWGKVLRICREYGLNHVRFHSFCPPEAAFEQADRLGIYFHVECSSWANQGASIGNGEAIDTFIYNEGDRIIKEYGNHPSFCMLAYGNEPAGRNQNAYLGKLLNYWKAKDNRRVYTSAAGWPQIPENDYHLTPAPRIHQWGDGLKDIINSAPPQTEFDFRDIVSKYSIPVVGHEIGQWCVYPDFSEISKYTGSLKATNFEIFRETLTENNMGDQAQEFLMASGKL
ncbi:MAG: sugar-binding domain-containing protein, partial [Chloroflexota bacterium]